MSSPSLASFPGRHRFSSCATPITVSMQSFSLVITVKMVTTVKVMAGVCKHIIANMYVIRHADWLSNRLSAVYSDEMSDANTWVCCVQWWDEWRQHGSLWSACQTPTQLMMSFIIVVTERFCLRDSERFQAAEVTFKVTQSNWYWCYLIHHYNSILLFNCNYMYVSILYCVWFITTWLW